MAKSPKERGLGKGLGALIREGKPVSTTPTKGTATKMENIPTTKAGKTSKGSVEKDAFDEGVVYIGLNDIKPNSDQPRKNFVEEKILELADSIKTHGVILPLIVRPAEMGYEIVAGERRFRAARKAGLKQVPCIVRELNDEENMVVSIIENMQREDLDPIEEAEGLNQMIKVYKYTQEEVSKNVGKSRPYITNALRLLNLSDNIKGYIVKGDITSGHGRALLGIKDPIERERIAARIATEGLSVRDVEKIATGKSEAKGKTKKKGKAKPAEMISVEEELKSLFGTKVTINGTAKKGAIALEYYSLEELNRLIDLLRSVE